MKRKKSGCIARKRRRTKKENPRENGRKRERKRVRRGPRPLGWEKQQLQQPITYRVGPSGGARPVESLRERLLSFVSGHLVLARRPSDEFGRVARVPSLPPPCSVSRRRGPGRARIPSRRDLLSADREETSPSWVRKINQKEVSLFFFSRQGDPTLMRRSLPLILE